MTTVATSPARAATAPFRPIVEPEIDSRPNGAWPAVALALVAASGLFIVAVADAHASAGRSAEPLFWLGLGLIFGPAAWRLADPRPGRRERLAVLEMLGATLYLVKVCHSPLGFDFHDELGQWRSTDDLIRTGRLFHENPIVAVYPHFPGLELATGALVKLGGVSIFVAGLILIGVARLVLVPALYLFFELATGAARPAGLAVLIYMANPNFLFFDADFSYESLALTLAIVSLLLTLRGGSRRHAIAFRLAAIATGAAVVVTHHMTSYALAAFLVVWGAIEVALSRRRRVRVAAVGLTIAVIAAVWLVAEGWSVITVYGPILRHALRSTVDTLAGSGGTVKRPFSTESGYREGRPQQLLGFASVALLLGGLTLAVGRALWLGARRRTFGSRTVVALGVVGAVYPATLAMRLTSAGTESSNRASEFVFLGLGALIALGVVEAWMLAPADGRARRLRALGFALAGTVTFLGGVVVGWPPYDRLPGPYLPGGDSRSVSPAGLAAASWARGHLNGGRLAGDLTTNLLLGSYGRLDPQGGVVGSLPVAQLFTTPAFGPRDRKIVEGDKLHYLAVDLRLAESAPASGSDFADAAGVRVEGPIPARDLQKFDHVPGLSKIYDNGAIRIYDTGSLGS